MARLHPAPSRVALLAEETPTRFAAFDVLAVRDRELLDEPLSERRRTLEAVLADPPPRIERVATGDAAAAARWHGSGYSRRS